MTKNSCLHSNCITWTQKNSQTSSVADGEEVRNHIFKKAGHMDAPLMRHQSSSCSPSLPCRFIISLFSVSPPLPLGLLQVTLAQKEQQIMDEGVLLHHHLSLMMTSLISLALLFSWSGAIFSFITSQTRYTNALINESSAIHQQSRM